jgi:hypothetical protein
LYGLYLSYLESYLPSFGQYTHEGGWYSIFKV